MNWKCSLDDRHVVVTGGGTGLGYAIAQAVCEAGARVTLIGRREFVLREAVEGLGEHASFIVGDITDLAEVPGIVQKASSVAPIDVLVDNAGRHLRKPALDTSDSEFAAVLATNVFGTFAVTREVARGMVARESGSIVIITSMAALYGIPGVAAYTASKSALSGLVRELAVEWSPHGVRVNALAPGFIETDMNREVFQKDPARLARILERTPMRRLGNPSEVASAAAFLASEAARFITGVCLPVDGGVSIGF